MILEISVVILLVLLLTLCYVIWNLNTKQEMLETWIEDFIQTIEKVNKELNDIDKALVFLYLEDKNYSEISDTLGISEVNARVKMNRIKKKLKSILNP